jgi:predicted MFS family arabinose efflux permease
LFTSWSPNIYFLFLAGFLTGAFSIIPQLIIPMAAHLALPQERGKTIGFVMSGLLIGILLSRTVSGWVGAHIGWRAMFLIAAILMVVLAIALYFLLPEVHPEYKGSYRELMRSLVSITKEEPTLRMAAMRGALCFAAFAGFWSTLVFLLQQPHFHAGSEVAGAFGLVGAFGALAASLMGRLSDRGNTHRLIALSIVLVIISFVVFGLSTSSMAGLVAGVILMDMGVQAAHISNQAEIFSIRPEARNRMNTVYMVTYFIGGALGTFLASQAWNCFHWMGVVAMGIIVSSIALLIHLSLDRSSTTVKMQEAATRV